MTPTSPTVPGPWWRSLTRYHWFVFTIASLAWMFDCLDQQIFVLARPAALAALMPEGTDPSRLKELGGISTSIFVAGWAMGGLIFGAVGDRIGRARTLAITVLLYSLCTGLSAFSVGFVDFAIYRFVTGLGVGGVFGLSVALVADSLPDRARPNALGLLQSLSAVGNITAGLIAVVVGWLETSRIEPGSSWRALFVIGALPAFLTVFIMLKLKEPEKWVQARAAGKAMGVQFGSYRALLGHPRWRKNAILGMLLCVSAVVGLWGIGFFSPELINDVMGRALASEGIPPEQIPGYRTMWTGINMVIQNTGSFFGMLAFTWAASRFGRRPVFAVGYLCAMGSTILVFQFLNERSDIFWMVPMMGFFQLSLFAGFAIVLPELFPVSLRSTGTSFCYNVGRFVAAAGPLFMGKLTAWLASDAETLDQKLDAFRNACAWMSLVFLVGLAVVPFLPETKGVPLPEDEPAGPPGAKS
ncbi:MAG: MFS transporter [Verrucomicrobiae bacterium]|nr:MFS transporter [Verrucomicrobiae bacterium]